MRATALTHPERIPHGTAGGWTNWGCRCPACHQAQLSYLQDYRRRRNAELAPHGTLDGYTNWGCRCRSCKDALTAYTKDYRRQKKRLSELPPFLSTQERRGDAF